MKLASVVLLSALTALPAWASSPGMMEGPPGCDWEATVVSVSASAPPELQLKLEKMHGSCMYAPSPCGQPGDKVTVATAGQDTAYQIGQTLHVWVAGNTATLTHPQCTRTPIAP